MKFFPCIIAACAAIAVSSCKKDIPAQIEQPTQTLKTVTADCTMFQWAKQIHGAGIKSVQSVVDPEYGFTYIAGTITDGAAVDLDPGPGEHIVTGWSGFIVRLSASGNFIWALPVEDNVVGFDMATATAHWLYIAYQLSTGKLVTSKIVEATGQIEWSKSIDILATVGQVQIAVDQGYNVYTSSIATSAYDLDPGPGVFKAPGSGTYRFVQMISGGNGNFITAVASADIKAAKQLASDGHNIYVLYLGNSNSNNCYLAKHNSKGARLYSKLINTATPPAEGVVPPPSMSLDDEGNAYVHHGKSLSRVDPAGVIKWKLDLGTDEDVKIVTNRFGDTYLANGSGKYVYPTTRLAKISKFGKLLYNKPLFDYTSHMDQPGYKYVRIAGLHMFGTIGVIVTGDFAGKVNFDPQGEEGILTGNFNTNLVPDIFAVSINTCD